MKQFLDLTISVYDDLKGKTILKYKHSTNDLELFVTYLKHIIPDLDSYVAKHTDK